MPQVPRIKIASVCSEMLSVLIGVVGGWEVGSQLSAGLTSDYPPPCDWLVLSTPDPTPVSV